MAIELSTAGILVKWAVEVTANTRPTTGYKEIRGVKSISEFNPEPNMGQVTPLSETEMHRYIPLLKDPGGAQNFTVNHYADFRADWTEMKEAFDTASADGKAVWIEYMIPNDLSFFYRGIPSELGFGGAEVDTVLENVAYITPNSAWVWAEHSA